MLRVSLNVGDLREPALRDGAFVLKQHKNAIHVVMGGIRTQNAVEFNIEFVNCNVILRCKFVV
jgi:hypothetical protein